MNYPHSSTITSPIRPLEATIMSDVAYGRANSSALRLMIGALIQRYEQRLSGMIEEARQCGEIRSTIDEKIATRLFIAAIQHLVFRALIVGAVDSIRVAAPGAFKSYRACMEVNQ